MKAVDLKSAFVHQPSTQVDPAGRDTGFVSELESRVAALQDGSLSRRALAQECTEILRRLLLRESGALNPEEGAGVFFRNLWEGGPLQRLFLDLFGEARAIVAGAGAEIGSIFSNPAKLQSEMETILAWYLKRRRALRLLEEAALPGDSEERLFGLQLFHDRIYCGVKGFEVRCNLCLAGRQGQQLWLKARLLNRGSVVKAAKGWELWADNTETLSLVDERPELDFMALVPLHPNCQRMIAEDVQAFVPYAALDLMPGRYETEIDLCLCDENGAVLLRGGTFEKIFIPDNVETDRRQNFFVPSPQALGLWGKDYAGGDQISDLRLNSSVRSGKLAVHRVVNLTLDCDIYGHAGERVYLECRLRYPDGTLVESQSEHFSAQGAFVYRLELYPQRPVVRLFGVQLQFSLRALKLENPRQRLLLELSLLGADERVLCGALEQFICDNPEVLPAAGDEEIFLPALPATDPYSGLTVSGFEVAMTAPPGQKERSLLRMDLYCACENWSSNVFRLVSGLESRAGETLLNRFSGEPALSVFHLGGYESDKEKRLTVTFDCRELDSEKLTNELVARASIRTLDDKVLFNLSRVLSDLSLPPAADGPSPLPPRPDLQIVDVAVEALLASKTLKCTFTFSVNFAGSRGRSSTLYCEIIDAAGRSLKQAILEEKETWSGHALRLDFSRQIDCALYRAGYFQERVALNLDVSRVVEAGPVRETVSNSAYSARLPEDGYYLKAMLFGAQGEVTQILRYPLALAAIHFQSEGASANRSPAYRPAHARRGLLQNIFG